MIGGQIILENINSYLLSKNWTIDDSSKQSFVPPINLGFDKKFKVYLPSKINASDFNSALKDLLQTLSEIYKTDEDDLGIILIEDKELLNIKIEDENIEDGKPDMNKFPKIIERLKKLLSDAANFTVTNKQHLIIEDTEEAERYLNLSKFLRNKKGSLITEIELPKREKIKIGTIFENPVDGMSINKKLIDSLTFINTDLIKQPINTDDVFLMKNKDFININLIDDTQGFYKEISLNDVSLSLQTTTEKKETFVKNLKQTDIKLLSEFTRTIKQRINEIIDTDDIGEIYGKVIKLSSEDVSGDKNSIEVLSIVNNVKTRLLIQLTSLKYVDAIHAHENNKTVKINGVLEKNGKNSYKVTSLKDFKVI